MARADPQLNFRCPAPLREKLESVARSNGRSLTAEIVTRLERSLSFEDEYGTLEEVMQEVWRDIDELKATVARHDEHIDPMRFERD